MSKNLKQRLAKLEETQAADNRITRIELVAAETGEVVGVIHVGGGPDPEGVLQALEYKHKTQPARTLRAREQGTDQEG